MLFSSAALLVALGALTSVEAVQYGNNHVSVRRDNELVAANFADTNVSLLSPAFLSTETVPADFANGTEGPTDDATLDYFIRSIAARNDWITYRNADFSSEEGRSFPYVLLSTSSQDSIASNGTGKLRVWIQGGVHGNEPAGDQAVLALLGKLDANQTWAASVLDRLDILLLPRYNPDGIAYFQRTFATNYDPNRDHIKLLIQQTRDIKRLFGSFAPHVAADMHEFSAPTRYGGNYLHASDALFSAAKNLNIHSDIRRISEELFVTRISSDLEAAGLRWEPYATAASNSTPGSSVFFSEAGSDGKIGRNALGLTQSVTFLCETRGIGIADQEFQRRTAAGLSMIESIVNVAAENADEVYTTIESAIEDFTSGQEDVIVTDSSEIQNRTYQMVDVRNGSVVDLPIRWASTTPVIANLTRSRPEAYLIPRAWSSLAARLEDSGLDVETLDYTFRGTVEALNITSTSFDDTYYEGTVPVTATAETFDKEIELPAGSFWVSTRQRNAALAFIALEPENIDSYVSFNIIPVEEGDEYPIFRIVE